ncbi:MAG: 50S ribosomal protein L6 [Gammaproteobacteria bacterium]|nr:50S ribosomal protein L6 [Gammaproteobacteria bacterium]MYD79878.1 50S ribosomal protein L6 [Gammaproteobacteria bacterium]
MSRLTERSLAIPKGVDVQITDIEISVKGPNGQLKQARADGVEVNLNGEEVSIRTIGETRQARAMTGTMQALLRNMMAGVSTKWEKRLELQGVGYRAQLQGKKLVLQLGFSHPVEFTPPENIEIATPTPTEIVVSGVDRQLVGQVAADIRSKRPPEPYKGKGVRYVGEYVKRKESKK